MKETAAAAPTLTLEPFGEEAKPAAAMTAVPAERQTSAIEEIPLTPEEKKMVDEFASKIELNNSNLVIQYGSGAQKKIADFSESALNNVRTKDLGEVGGLLSDVVTELKTFDADDDEKGFLGVFQENDQEAGQHESQIR